MYLRFIYVYLRFERVYLHFQSAESVTIFKFSLHDNVVVHGKYDGLVYWRNVINDEPRYDVYIPEDGTVCKNLAESVLTSKRHGISTKYWIDQIFEVVTSESDLTKDRYLVKSIGTGPHNRTTFLCENQKTNGNIFVDFGRVIRFCKATTRRARRNQMTQCKDAPLWGNKPDWRDEVKKMDIRIEELMKQPKLEDVLVLATVPCVPPLPHAHTPSTCVAGTWSLKLRKRKRNT